MNQEQLNAIKKRVAKASVGPWFVVEEEFIQNVSSVIGAIHFSRDAHFIAHAREDVPALVVEVERLREALTKILDYNTFDLAKFETEVIEIARQALADETK